MSAIQIVRTIVDAISCRSPTQRVMDIGEKLNRTLSDLIPHAPLRNMVAEYAPLTDNYFNREMSVIMWKVHYKC